MAFQSGLHTPASLAKNTKCGCAAGPRLWLARNISFINDFVSGTIAPFG
jgi:hypothetical protein